MFGMSVQRNGNARNALDGAYKRMMVAGDKGLRATAFKLMEESLQLVPEDTSALKNSAVIAKAEVTGLYVMYYVGYGMRELYGETIFGPGVAYARWSGVYSPKEERFVTRVPANYAWVQHFDLDLHHTKGQALFLTTPIYTNMQGLRQAFRDGVRANP